MPHGKPSPFGQNALNLDALFAISIFALIRVVLSSFMQNYVVIIMWEAFELHALPKSMHLNLVRVTPRKKSHMPTAHGIGPREYVIPDIFCIIWSSLLAKLFYIKNIIVQYYWNARVGYGSSALHPGGSMSACAAAGVSRLPDEQPQGAVWILLRCNIGEC
jgi:hypothetical protein